MNEELIEFYEELRDAAEKQAEHLIDYLIEDNPENYIIGKSDCGCYNNGVGFVTIDEQVEFDKDKALLDAYERMAQDINNGGDDLELYYELFANNNRLQTALAKLILRIGGI